MMGVHELSLQGQQFAVTICVAKSDKENIRVG